MLEIVGAGFGRTGTLSLKQAFERLGFGPCHHMIEVVEKPGQLELWSEVARTGTGDWDAVYRGYRSTVDWPGARYWHQLADHFPQAKVVLTVRDPMRWYESAAESIYQVGTSEHLDPQMARLQQFVRQIVWEGDFGGRFDDMEHAIGVFNEHNQAVRRAIPADRLLVFEVRDGWEPLCEFLDVPVPDEPFPHANDRQAFAAMVAERRGHQ